MTKQSHPLMSVPSFHEMSELLKDHLFLSAAHVIKHDSLRQRQISLIVNATVEEPSLYLKNGDYLKIRVSDHPYARLDVYFDVVADKIKANKEKGGRTLVHCVAGVSRSATLCIAYLMKHERMSLRQAYRFVKTARPIVRPNWGFWRQLINYEIKLNGSPTVKMVASKWGPTEPVPDVYTNEVKVESEAPQASSFVQTIASPNANHNGYIEEPRKVRATTFELPGRMYTRRSRSEHGSLGGNSYSPHNAQLYDSVAQRPATPRVHVGHVTIQRGPGNTTTTMITFGGRDNIENRSSPSSDYGGATKYGAGSFNDLSSRSMSRTPFRAL